MTAENGCRRRQMPASPRREVKVRPSRETAWSLPSDTQKLLGLPATMVPVPSSAPYLINSQFRDELLNGEVFCTLREAQVPSPDRKMEAPLQHSQTPQRPALPSPGTRKHYADRPKTDYALTSKLDHLMGAVQWAVLRAFWQAVSVLPCFARAQISRRNHKAVSSAIEARKRTRAASRIWRIRSFETPNRSPRSNSVFGVSDT